MRSSIYLFVFVPAVVPIVCFSGTASVQAAPIHHKAPPARRAASTNTPVSQAYLARLRSKVLRNWIIPDGKNHVVLTATLNSDGSAETASLTSSPKNDSAEQAGNEAFAKSLPLESVPTGIATPAKLVLTFESSADPHGDSSSNLYTQLIPAPPAHPAQAEKSQPAGSPEAAPVTK